jgi:hypothetical protein
MDVQQAIAQLILRGANDFQQIRLVFHGYLIGISRLSLPVNERMSSKSFTPKAVCRACCTAGCLSPGITSSPFPIRSLNFTFFERAVQQKTVIKKNAIFAI